ncbi:hypothetical protein Cantr_06752 [Candida viswanathii]|uniref:Uncharacterized protein n=1 Tax=Candida viswanathii TaxID=5486 RepID=A0A367XV76_9ASCO|nr:hypothetical protein Cantr_06752 [Candida viswanathii]
MYFYLLAIPFITLAYHFINKRPRHTGVLKSITPVPSTFSWSTQPPLPIRPFVKKRDFNPSMGDWLLIEDTYLSTINLRKKSIESEPELTSYVHDSAISKESLAEFYDIMVSKVTNTITGDTFLRTTSTSMTTQDIMRIIAGTIEEDFLILIKDNPGDKDEEYKLRASLNCFPAGFDPRVNFDQPVSFIHKPVPQYEARLRFTMGKFFNNLKDKDMWVRHNWSVQTHGCLFNAGSNHGRAGDEIVPLRFEEIDFEKGCFLRCERQVFVRLPKTRTVLMTIRTYLTPIDKIKEEGNAAELIRGIDSLPDDLAFYKKRGVWGEAVKEYLRV